MGLRRVGTYAIAWTSATTAAVALSWFGVREVMRDAVFDQGEDIPEVATRQRPPAPPVPPPASETSPSPPKPAPTAPSPTGTTAAPPSSTPNTDPSPDEESAGNVRGYDVAGGRVVVSLNPDSASLVSATPKSGYETRTWRQAGWLRVDLSAGEHGSAVFVTWNDHPPMVDVYEY